MPTVTFSKSYAVSLPLVNGEGRVIQFYDSLEQLRNAYSILYRHACKLEITKPVPLELSDGTCRVLTDIIKEALAKT